MAIAGRARILDASWTAPITNIDGGPSTDLASYRVYYGISATPCSGPSLLAVASSTPTPCSLPNRKLHTDAHELEEVVGMITAPDLLGSDE